MVRIGEGLPVGPAIGSELEVIFAPDLSVPLPWKNRDTFAYNDNKTFFGKVTGQFVDLPTGALQVDAMRRMADLHPQGLSQDQAQAALEQPFEWRGFCGGDLPRLDGSGDIQIGGHPTVHGTVSFADWTPEQLAQRAQQALDDAGVSNVRVRGGESFDGNRLAAAVRRDQSIPALVLEHDFGANHWAAVETFRRAWSQASEHLPPLFLNSTATIDTAETRVARDLPLLERFARVENSKLLPHTNGVTDEEFAVLRDWTRERYGLELPRDAAYRAVLSLMSQPLHDMPADQIERCLEAHEELGTITRFSADIFRRLISQYGTRFSEPANIHLTTHLKNDGAPYLILQQLLGADRPMSISTSTYSGSGMLRGLATLNGIDVRSSKPQRVDRGVILRKRAAAGPVFPAPGDPPLIVEKGGKVIAGWLKSHSAAEILDAINNGRVVVIPHNRDDLDHLSKLLDHPFSGRCLNNTLCKQEEARRVGHRLILQTAEITRYAWDLPVAAAEVVVLGAGLMGGGVIDAALARGMDPAHITVVDRDSEVRAHYRAQGCRVYASIGEASEVPRERAVVVNGLPGSAGNLDTLLGLSRDTIFLSLTSGGKGLDWSSNATDLYYRSAPDHYWSTDYDWEHYRTDYPDEVFWQGDRRLRVIATGMPPNLIEEQWSQLSELTPDLVSGAVLEAMVHPGDTPALPADLDRDMLDLYRQHGGEQMQRFQGYDDAAWSALLDEFKPSTEIPTRPPSQRPREGFVLYDPRSVSRGFGQPGRREPRPEPTPQPAGRAKTI